MNKQTNKQKLKLSFFSLCVIRRSISRRLMFNDLHVCTVLLPFSDLRSASSACEFSVDFIHSCTKHQRSLESLVNTALEGSKEERSGYFPPSRPRRKSRRMWVTLFVRSIPLPPPTLFSRFLKGFILFGLHASTPTLMPQQTHRWATQEEYLCSDRQRQVKLLIPDSDSAGLNTMSRHTATAGQPLWPSGKALGWQAEGMRFDSASEGDSYTYRYTVTTRMTPALRWAEMRAILMFH